MLICISLQGRTSMFFKVLPPAQRPFVLRLLRVLSNTLLGIGECRENRQQLRCGNAPQSSTGPREGLGKASWPQSRRRRGNGSAPAIRLTCELSQGTSRALKIVWRRVRSPNIQPEGAHASARLRAPIAKTSSQTMKRESVVFDRRRVSSCLKSLTPCLPHRCPACRDGPSLCRRCSRLLLFSRNSPRRIRPGIWLRSTGS